MAEPRVVAASIKTSPLAVLAEGQSGARLVAAPIHRRAPRLDRQAVELRQVGLLVEDVAAALLARADQAVTATVRAGTVESTKRPPAAVSKEVQEALTEAAPEVALVALSVLNDWTELAMAVEHGLNGGPSSGGRVQPARAMGIA